MNLQHVEEKHLEEERDAQQSPSEVVTSSFLELFALLEEYAPVWYTEGHHNRAVAAVRSLQQS